MQKIPLRARDGSVRAYALVDDEDYPAINAYRWHLLGPGYAARSLPKTAEGKRGMALMHREILGLPRMAGRSAPQGNHINFNRLDNRRVNLEVVTPGENLLHSWTRRKTETCRVCGGNEWQQCGGSRRCAICHRNREMARNRANGAQPRGQQTHCRRGGHEYTPENTFVNSNGRRECRTCIQERRATKRTNALRGREAAYSG